MNGCRIGVADGSYQKDLLEKWLDSNQIHAEVVACKGYDEMIEKLDADELDALVIPALSVNSDFIAIANIGAGDCYFGVSKSRPDLLKELNATLEEINNTETDYSSKLYASYEGKAVSYTHLGTACPQELVDFETVLKKDLAKAGNEKRFAKDKKFWDDQLDALGEPLYSDIQGPAVLEEARKRHGNPKLRASDIEMKELFVAVKDLSLIHIYGNQSGRDSTDLYLSGGQSGYSVEYCDVRLSGTLSGAGR